MKSGSLRHYFGVLLIAAMLFCFAGFSQAETYRLISPLNSTLSLGYVSGSPTFEANLTISDNDASQITGFAFYWGQPGTWGPNVTNSSFVWYHSNTDGFGWDYPAWSNNTEYQLSPFVIQSANEGLYNWTIGIYFSDIPVFVSNNISLVVDDYSPTSSLISPSGGNYSLNVTVNISAVDSSSGISKAQYRFESPNFRSGWIPEILYGNFYSDIFVADDSQTISKNNYFVLSNYTAEGKLVNRTYRYTGSTKITGTAIITIRDDANTETNWEYTDQAGDAGTGPADTSFNIGGSRYKVWNTSSMENNDFTIKIDQNADLLLYNQTNGPKFIDQAGNIFFLGDGKYNISVNATDASGKENITLNATQITIDHMAPSVVRIFLNKSSSSSGDIAADNGFVTVNATVFDNGTGIASASFRYENSSENGTWTQMSGSGAYYFGSINVSLLAEGKYNFSINASDYQGFENTSVKYSFRIIRSAATTNASVGPINDSDHDGNIEMSWQDDASEPNATYIIFRSTAGVIQGYNASRVTNVTLSRIASGVQHFEDNTTLSGTTYYYAIMTVNALGYANLTQNSTNIGYWSAGIAANDTIAPSIVVASCSYDDVGNKFTLSWDPLVYDLAGNFDFSGNVTYKVYKNSSKIPAGLAVVNTTLFSVVRTGLTGTSTTVSESDPGRYYLQVTAVDDAGNENTTYFDNSDCRITIEQNSGGDDSGGGSTGGGATGGAPSTAIKVQHSWTTLGIGTTTMQISKAGLYFTELAFTLGKSSSNAVLIVQALSSKPSAITSITNRNIYQYIQVDKTNILDSSVNRVVVKFKIEKKKLLDDSVSAGSVVLMRYNETSKKWVDLLTSLQDVADPIYYYYQASSPGLSVFAIASKPAAASTPVEQPATNTSTPTAPLGNNTVPATNSTSGSTTELVKEKGSFKMVFIIIGIAIVAGALLGAVGYIFYRRRNGGFGGLKVSRPPTMKQPSYKL
jgi:PGF-pre-PGF domain-containing protein